MLNSNPQDSLSVSIRLQKTSHTFAKNTFFANSGGQNRDFYVVLVLNVL